MLVHLCRGQRSMSEVSHSPSTLMFGARLLTEPGAHSSVWASWSVASRDPRVSSSIVTLLVLAYLTQDLTHWQALHRLTRFPSP